MKTAITHGILITGDGKTRIDDSLVLIENNLIKYAGKFKDFNQEGYKVIEASGNLVMPGIINVHAHGIIPNTPLFSSGSPNLDYQQVTRNLKKHLQEGTTTLINVDGFVDPEEVIKINQETPINMLTAIANTPKCYAAAKLIDGQGIKKQGNYQTIIENYSQVIIAFGECGSGATLGGGVQDYIFIPEHILKEHGLEISTDLAKQIKEAVLGRAIDEKLYDEKELARLITTNNLEVDPEDIRNTILNCVLPSFQLSLDSIIESATAANQYGLPTIIHSAAASMDLLEELTQSNQYAQIIAAHSNHPSYTLLEAIEFAKKLKNRGVIIDISTFDTLNTRNTKEIDYFLNFLQNGVVDTVSTDYGGGNHCSILSMLELAIQEQTISLPQAVSLITHNPATIFSPLNNKGLIKENYTADIIITNAKFLSKIKTIIINGNTMPH